MVTAPTPAVLDSVDLIQIDFRIWTGAAKMDTEDYVHVSADDLPAAKLASLGSLRLISRAAIAPLHAFRQRADKICREVGVPLLSGWAVPRSDSKATIGKLANLVAEFDVELASFVADYDRLVDEWVAENAADDPAYAERIRVAKIDSGMIRQRFGHRLSVFQVTGSPMDTTDSMQSTSSDLRSSVLAAVVTDLHDYVEKVTKVPNGYFKSQVRRNILRIAGRLRRFSFIDPVAFPAYASALEAVAQGNGKIDGADYDTLATLIKGVWTVSDLETAMADCLSTSKPPADLLSAIVASKPQGATAPAGPNVDRDETPADPVASDHAPSLPPAPEPEEALPPAPEPEEVLPPAAEPVEEKVPEALPIEPDPAPAYVPAPRSRTSVGVTSLDW